MPLKLQEFAEQYLQGYPSYGLLVWDPEGEFNYVRRLDTKVTLILSAKKLKKKRTAQALETVTKRIIHRATSELVALRLKESKLFSEKG